MNPKFTKLREDRLPDVSTKNPGKRLGRQLQALSANRAADLLSDVANVEPTGLKSFWKKWGSLYQQFVTEIELLHIRDELRLIWKRERGFQVIPERWLTWTQPSNGWLTLTWTFMPEQSLLMPNPMHLRATLAFALPTHFAKMAVCGNEDCPARYFFQTRAKQGFCERPECLAFGQRKQKREWWKKNRSEKRKGSARTS